jgi:hypothetical protein
LSAERVRRLSLGVPVVDDVFPGFENGDFGVLYGEGSSLMGFVLCVRCVLPTDLHGLGCDVVFVDGGNSFSPYLVSEVARGYGFDPRYVLERIYVSRAFTAYQLSALILEKLEPFTDRHDVGLVFVSDIASLFLDRDIPKREAVDVPIAQAYLYDRDVFPLAHVLVFESGNRFGYELLDSVESCDNEVPRLRSMCINVDVERRGAVRSFSDKIGSISLEMDNKTVVISEGDEADKILELVKTVREVDPDIVFTRGGDSFLFPYLAYRAFVNGVLDKFVLSREAVPLKAKRSRGA